MASTQTKTLKKEPKPVKWKPLRIKPKEGELVLVTWMDACTSNGWEDIKKTKAKTAHIVSIGWVGESPDPSTTLVLHADKAHDNPEDHESNRRIAIPLGWVTSFKKVKA